MKALQEAPKPANNTELNSYLGLLRYYVKFLPNAATVLQTLDELKKEKTKWLWNHKCEVAFQRSKEMILKAPVLCHFDAIEPVKLACDASAYGLGAVLSHQTAEGVEKPILFASRKMTDTRKNYAQVEREALALIFGVKKFHQYLWGRKFTLETNRKPLVTILGPKTGIPTLATARLQRWACCRGTHMILHTGKNLTWVTQTRCQDYH